MGNQGTTNWKFIAFFAISLMLIAGLFSNAAIAGNGDGKITVGWRAAGLDTDIPDNSYDTDPVAEGAQISLPLAAGSRGNVLQFTYTVPITTSMAGGMLQIAIPAGWKQLKIAVDDTSTTGIDETTLYQSVTIVSKGETLYQTTVAAQDTTITELAVDAKATQVASYGSVSITDTKIEVTLGSNWFNGGTLVITLGNVQTDIPSSLRVAATGTLGETGYYPDYTAYRFEARSQERNGRLVRLRPSTDNPSPQPRVRVGNILGTRTVDADGVLGDSPTDPLTNINADITKRVVAVTPAISYPGEEHDYIVTFTAPGPMYGHKLAITFPDTEHLTLPTDKTVASQLTVRAPGAAYTFDPAEATDLTDRTVTIDLIRINKNQKVTVTLRDMTVADGVDATAEGASEYIDLATAPTAAGIGAAVTTITGGAFGEIAGSGKLAASPDNAKAKAIVSRITLTYTAVTSLTNATLQITVPTGIMASAATSEEVDNTVDPQTTPPTMRDTFLLQMTDPKKKGYVSSPDKGPAPVLVTAANDDDDNADINLSLGEAAIIRWTGVTLAKDKTFKTYITGVRVQDEGGRLAFTAQVTQGTATLTALPEANVADARFYVIVTENEDVTFGADKHFLRAASLNTVTFTFTAGDTPIRNGKVQFNIPSGWSAPVKSAKADDDVIGRVTVAGTAGPRYKEDLSVSGRSITVSVPNANIGETVIVTYGGADMKAMIQTRATVPDKPLKINGYYWASGSSPRRGAGTVTIEVGNANDGTGKGTISPTTVRAGSIDETFTIRYVAAGTMDGGQVSLEHPADWGQFATDPSTLNYVRVSASSGASISEIDNGGSIIIVTLDKCPPNGRITFVYGTGTGAQRGARAQDATGVADFMLKSQGDDFGSLMGVMGDRKKETVTDDDPKYLGETFIDAAGMLRVDVTGADDGRGTGEVTLVASKAGDGAYIDKDGEAVTEMRVHAADDATYIKVVYTATETIENGMLKFTAPAGWSKPQGSDPGEVGFTSVQGTGGASIDPETYADAATDLSLEVPIALMNAGDTIEIHYGETAGSGGGAVAPAASGAYRFMIATKGGDADTNVFKAIRGTVEGKPLEIKVYSQASGGGTAAVTAGDDDLTAGGSAAVTVVYTAAGDINNGMLKLMTPANWSHPLMSNVAITSTGSIGSASASDFGGYYVGDPDDTEDDIERPTGTDVITAGDMEVLVDSVRLDAGDTVTFVFSAAMVQAAMGDAAFGVMVDGGAGPGMGAAAVAVPEGGTLAVTVGEAAAGSGTAAVDLMGMAVVAGSMANELTFNYTAVGTIGYPREIRVTIPAGWSEPNSGVDNDEGTYTVALTDEDGRGRANVVEALAAVDRDLVVRVRAGSATVNAGDVVSITYTNADAPRTVGASMFEVLFDDVQVGDNVSVLVGSGKDATMLMVDASPDMILMEGDESVAVTVELQDEDGNEVPAAADMDVMLASSSATGSFMVDGEAATMVTITAGSSSAMAYYSDSSFGEATITASSGTLTAGTATVTVTTDMVEITSVTVTSLAMAGDTVTVSARGTAGKTATFSVGAIVTDGMMTEAPAGSYSGSFDVVVDQHADGDYTVTVNLNGQSMTASLTIDSTAPTVTVSDIEGMVANGDTVMISAMVADAGDVASVMADVSMLDSTQTDMVALTMADGAYSAAFMISEDNAAMNGVQTITVTAMDAAGNSGMGSTTAELMNTLSFTSMIPAGISLFHVPLDVEGLDTVGDLEAKLGDNVNLLITYDGTSWNSRSDDVMITATLGILVSLSAETSVTFEGHAWDDGSSMISLQAGSNLIGLPVDIEGVDMISDIMGIFDEGVVSSIIVSSGGEFQLVAAAGDAADGPVAGDAAYLVMASEASAAVMGDGWMNGEMAGAAPIALAGYTVDNQTPVLDLLGSVVDEITGLAKEGFRVKAKNLSTKAALSNVTSVEATEGYNMTFVDLADSYAARVGDVLEISADSPDPLLGIKPVRHIVTVDDVKNTRIQLEDLIAYEIPAETELLRNYPNPFNPETWIPYRLAEDADVSLTIYDTSGALVRSIDLGHQTAAVYETRAKAIYWDGRNRFGEQVASGIYFYSLSTGDFSATRKMVILK